MLPTPEVLVGAGLLFPGLPSVRKGSAAADLPPVDQLVNEDGLEFREVVEQRGGDEDDVLPGKVCGCR
jgi:hypothetical protein